jgi:DNA-binding transcriptional LysR family regulator
MPFDIAALRYAVLTAKTFSFARAAAQAGVKQSTLSKRISGLEHRIGVKLFERSTRGAFPPEVGLGWLDEASRVLGNLNALHIKARAIGAGHSGTIGIGFSTSLAAGNMRALIADLVHRFPELRVHGIEGDRVRLAQALESHGVDFAVLSGKLPDTGLERLPLWSERVMVVLPEGHSLAKKDRVYWTDLRRERFILPQQDPGADLAEVARARLSEPGWQPDIEVHEVSRDNVANMVPIGRFISLTTETVLGRSLAGVTLREVYDAANGVAHVDYAGYWRCDNQNPVLVRLLKLVKDRYPA